MLFFRFSIELFDYSGTIGLHYPWNVKLKITTPLSNDTSIIMLYVS